MNNKTIVTVTHKGKSQELVFNSLENLSSADTFIVVGPGFYGYGESIAAARKNCIAAGCPRSKKMLGYLGDESLGVSGFGIVSAQKVLICLGEVQ